MARITMISESDYRTMSFRNATGGTDSYTNGVSIDRIWNDNWMGYRLDYDTDENTFYLVRYKGVSVNNGFIDDTNGEDIISFNSDTKELSILCDIDELRDDNSISSTSIVVMRFLREIMLNHKEAVAGTNVYRVIKQRNMLQSNTFANILKYYDSVQSIEKLGDKFMDSLREPDFSINTDVRERHKALNLPKRVVQFIEQLEADRYNRSYTSTYLRAFQKMQTGDSNELIALIDYLEMYAKLSKKIPNQNGGSWNGAASPGNEQELVAKIGDIKEFKPELDVRKILNYLIKQHFNCMFSVGYSNPNHDPIRFAATIPSRMAGIYFDYLKMNPVDPFPQDLYKSHNILALESKIVITDEEASKFNEYGTMLATRYNMDIGKFRFEVPTDYRKFVDIGKTFMNCLPTCGKAFYNGKCDIVFIYGENDVIPKYAIELDKYADVIQAKTTRDMDISDETVLEAIEKYVRKLQS